MAKILNIETSTRVCSVSVWIDNEIVSVHETNMQNSHAENITIFCENAVKDAGIGFPDLDAVAVSMGPGSYTGLRIGVSTAKGYCFGLNIPLISISTLKAMAFGMTKTYLSAEETLFVPMIDARRMEVYSAIFNKKLEEIEGIKANIIDANSFAEHLSNSLVVFAGDGAAKCKEVLGHNKNAVFADDFGASSKYIGELAQQKFDADDFEDTAYFEPYYLKDFVAGKPKVKGLR